MKLPLILIITFWTLSAAGQIEPVNKKDAVAALNSSIKNKEFVVDTIPILEFRKAENGGLQPVYYINGEITNSTIIKTIDPHLIDSIHLEKEEIVIKDKKYYGQIFLKMKNEYHPEFISLTDLRSKYLGHASKPVIFMINDDIVKGNYEQYLVDEKFILKIIVDNVEDKEQKLNVEIVRLLTKSEENIKKAKEIRIRGLNETTMN